MGLFKRIKKLKKKAFGIIDPVAKATHMDDKIFGKDKQAAGPTDPGLDVFGERKQGDEYYQGQLDKEMGNYRGAHDVALAGAKADAQRAGTYADTREGNASLEGEAGARQRGMQAVSLNRINLLRKQLGLPETTEIAG
jgi:hypothetical protein